ILFASFLALMLILGYYGLFLNKSKKTPGQEVSNKSGISSNEKLPSSLNDSSDLQLTVEQWLSFDKNPESSISESKSDVAVQEEHSANQDRPEPEAESVVLDESPQEYSPGRLGYLTISCTPWAAVYIDGDSIGATPFENSMELTAGRHEIIMKNPEFPRYREWIEIRNGEKTTIELSLWSLAGTLKLTVSPWAEIYVDGEYKDTVPPQDRPIILSPGRHSLILKHPVLGEWQTPIEISAGQSLELKFNLKNLISR
ncbi:MAG: PEGA domain-containing protein, partial [bacterium]